MSSRAFIYIVLLLVALPQSALAEDYRPKIGLVLSGGGARGAAHIGVIKALEELQVPIDYIAGTSMGAIIGGLYASGLSANEVEEAFNSIDWESILANRPKRKYLSIRRKVDDALFLLDREVGVKNGRLQLPTGVLRGHSLYSKLRALTLHVSNVEDFDQLAIPFRCVAANIVSGDQVVLDSGDLTLAIRASMGVPAVFPAIEIDGDLLVDGGISNNVPIDVARNMGADIVIVSNISTPLLEREDLNSAGAILAQLVGLLGSQSINNQLASLTAKDVLITPQLGGLTSLDFSTAHESIPIGSQATQEQEQQLATMSLKTDEYRRHVDSRTAPKEYKPNIDFVTLDNRSSISGDYFRRRLSLPLGTPLDHVNLNAQLNDIYGLGIFQHVSYRLDSQEEQTGLNISVEEKAWGPNYLQLGLAIESSPGADSDMSLLLGHVRIPSSKYNGEWRSLARLGDNMELQTEYYHPLGLGSPYFISGRLSYSSRRYSRTQDGLLQEDSRINEFEPRLAIGRELGTLGRVELSYAKYYGHEGVRIGSGSNGNDDGSELRLGFLLDTLDEVTFPKSGVFGLTELLYSETEFGEEDHFSQLRLNWFGAKTWGDHTLQLSSRLLWTYDGKAPLRNLATLGGLFQLPGYVNGELSNENLLLLRTGYMRNIYLSDNLNTYIGGSIQLGNVFANENDISLSNSIWSSGVWLGADTLLGPLYIGYGHAEGGKDNLYLKLGLQF